jgi:hypothetical protein
MRSKRAARSNRSTSDIWKSAFPRHLPKTLGSIAVQFGCGSLRVSHRREPQPAIDPNKHPTCNDRSKSRSPLGYFALRCLSPFKGLLDERMLRIRGYGRFFGQFRRVVCRRFICPIFDTPLGHLDWQVWIFARTHGPRGSSPNGAAGDHGRSRERLGAECHATDQLVVTGFWGTGAAAAGNR